MLCRWEKSWKINVEKEGKPWHVSACEVVFVELALVMQCEIKPAFSLNSTVCVDLQASWQHFMQSRSCLW